MTRPVTTNCVSIWAVSDGRAGNAAQVKAIIEALSHTDIRKKLAHISGGGHRHDPIILSPRPPWTWLPKPPWPAAHLALPRAQRRILTKPWPTLWIAAGRRSAPYSLAVRRWSAGQTFTVHILHPKSDPELYDLLIIPEHDQCNGPNIITTTGALTHFSLETIAIARRNFAHLASEGERSVMVSLGGHSKAHTFTKTAASTLITQLKALNIAGWHIRISASRRTPAPIIAAFRAFATRIGADFWAGPDDGPNPYLAWLLYSQTAIVTADSANMLADAAWHGLPLHIARLPTRHHAPKFDHLYTSLIKRGAARWFTGDLACWQYSPVRDAERIAGLIAERLLERHPRPPDTGP